MLRATNGIQFSGGAIGLKSVGVLAQSAVSVSLTGTTAKTTLATISVPAKAMSASGALRITTIWSTTNNSDTKTAEIDFGGTKFWAPNAPTDASFAAQVMIINRNATNSQVCNQGSGGYGGSGSAVVTGSVDTTQAQTLTISGTLGTSTDTMTLEAYMVEVLNP
jgi:hypothetical protein